MYVAYVAIWFGIFRVSGERALLGLTAVVAAALHVWILWIEEPPLLRRFGEPYDEYRRSVPRWLGRPSGR